MFGDTGDNTRQEKRASTWRCHGCWLTFPVGAMTLVDEPSGGRGFRCPSCSKRPPPDAPAVPEAPVAVPEAPVAADPDGLLQWAEEHGWPAVRPLGGLPVGGSEERWRAWTKTATPAQVRYVLSQVENYHSG